MTGGDAAAVPQSEEHAGQGAVLLSINVGLPQEVGWEGRTVYTGVFKHPVPGPRMVRRLNIDGDGQGDTAGHGGEQRAVLVYQIESYRYWEQHLGRADLTSGMFGENFTVEGLADDAVCIGDRYRIGEAEFEVTQLRVTCFRVGMRLGEPELPALLVGHHCPGFYLRTVEPAWSGFRPLRVTTIVPETPTVVSILLISGGIGVTPVLAMLHQLAAERSGRDVWWIHGARSPGSIHSPLKPTPWSRRSRTPTSTCSTAPPRPTSAAAPGPRPAVSAKGGWGISAFRPMRAPTCAGRRRS